MRAAEVRGPRVCERASAESARRERSGVAGKMGSSEFIQTSPNLVWAPRVGPRGRISSATQALAVASAWSCPRLATRRTRRVPRSVFSNPTRNPTDSSAEQTKSAFRRLSFRLLALLNDFRTFDWASEYKYPTVVLDQMKGLLAKYENV